MTEKPKRIRFRFSVRLLLMLMTLAAVDLVGRRNGYQKGREEALMRVPSFPSASDAAVFWLNGYTDKPGK